jgi:hypothetical protein
MYRSLVALPVLLLLAVPAIHSAPKPKEGKQPYYLPVTVGDRWEMEWRVNGGKSSTVFSYVVSAVEQKDDMLVVSVSEKNDGEQDSIRKLGVSEKGVFFIDTPYCLLRLPPKDGDTWEEQVGKGKLKFKSVREEIEVKAGKFKCVRVDMEDDQQPPRRRTRSWYAPSRGCVKRIWNEGQNEFVEEMISFTPAPVKK